VITDLNTGASSYSIFSLQFFSFTGEYHRHYLPATDDCWPNLSVVSGNFMTTVSLTLGRSLQWMVRWLSLLTNNIPHQFTRVMTIHRLL